MQTITDASRLPSLDRIVCRAAGRIAASQAAPDLAAKLLAEHSARTAAIRPLPLLVAARGAGVLDG